MTKSLVGRSRRPSWMMPFGHEGWGDVFFDRLWPEWRRDFGEEWTPTIDFYEKDGKYHLTAKQESRADPFFGLLERPRLPVLG